MNKLSWVIALLYLNLLIVGCDNGKTTETVFPAQATSAACASASIANRYVVHWENGNYSVVETESHVDDEIFRNTYVKDNLAAIKHVDRDIRISINQISKKDLSTQSGISSWGPNKIEAPAVWSQGFQGQNVRVGIVDGMVDASHVQLRNNILVSEQFNDEINNSQVNIHGTHVAGIIAADPSKGPVVGVAPAAKIIAGQFIGNDGGGSLGDAIIAMNYVAAQGVKVINMSWGGAPCVQNLRSALQELSSKDILIVTASGNDGLNSDYSPTYPAAFMLDSQINVAASTSDDYMIYFSNFGFKTVNILAPGVNIFSTVPGNKSTLLDGTSMAAPMVTGTAALLWSAFPNASSQQVKIAILNSVDVARPNANVSSRGRINARKALDTLRSMLQ
ncbi:MAG: S8 family peptidase [Pseudobdellovibrio sp.]